VIEEAIVEALTPTLRELIAEELEKPWPWRTPEQVAALLDITPAAVRARVRRGQIPGHFHHGRIYVDLREFDEQLRQAPVLP
jgi:predicted transcriptional regulator